MATLDGENEYGIPISTDLLLSCVQQVNGDRQVKKARHPRREKSPYASTSVVSLAPLIRDSNASTDSDSLAQKSRTFIGMDLSTKSWVLAWITDGELTQYVIISAPTLEMSAEERLYALYCEFKNYLWSISSEGVKAIGIEEANHGRNVNTQKLLVMAFTMALIAVKDSISCFTAIPVHNKVWKHSLAIKGKDRKTQKENVKEIIRTLFSSIPEDAPQDVYDAIGVAYNLWSNELIERGF